MQTSVVQYGIPSKGTTDVPCVIQNNGKIIGKGVVHVQNGSNEDMAISQFEATFKKFVQAKACLVAKAWKEIQNLVSNEFTTRYQVKSASAEKTDLVSFKVTHPQLPSIFPDEPNTAMYTFRKSVLVEVINPDIKTEIEGLTKIEEVCFNSLMNDVVEKVDGDFFGSFAYAITKAESVTNLEESKIVQSIVMKTLNYAKEKQPILFTEKFAAYWTVKI